MKSGSIDDYTDIDQYITYQEQALQPMLKKIRVTIQAVVPGATECISYMIPCYKHHGMLVGFGTHKKGCSFYVMSNTLLNLYAAELKDLQYTGSTIRFHPNKPLPIALIKKLTRHRVKQNEEKAMLKNMLTAIKSKKNQQ